MISSSDSHPFGCSARRFVVARQRGQHRPTLVLASARSRARPTLLRKTLLLLARLRRFLNGRVAAAIAHHEQEAVMFAQRKLHQCQPDSARLYRGPIDQVMAKAARLSKRAA